MSLIHAVTKEPVPVKCKSAHLCSKDRCLLKYWNRWDKCMGYDERKDKSELTEMGAIKAEENIKTINIRRIHYE